MFPIDPLAIFVALTLLISLIECASGMHTGKIKDDESSASCFSFLCLKSKREKPKTEHNHEPEQELKEPEWEWELESNAEPNANWVVKFSEQANGEQICSGALAAIRNQIGVFVNGVIIPHDCATKLTLLVADIEKACSREAHPDVCSASLPPATTGSGEDIPYELSDPLTYKGGRVIALRPLKTNSETNPIPLTGKEILTDSKATAVYLHDKQVQSTRVRIIDERQCPKRHDNTRVFCVRSENGQPFYAASGSPLYVRKGDQRFLIGIHVAEMPVESHSATHLYFVVQ